MSVVIAYKDGDTTYFGADTAATEVQTGAKFEGVVKFWRVEQPGVPLMMVGSCGTGRGAQLLRYVYKWPTCNEGENMAPEAYLAGPVAESVRQMFSDHGLMREQDGMQGTQELILIAIEGRIFAFDGCFGLDESLCGYAAIGSGADLALGTLYALRTQDITPRDRLRLALETAEHFNAFVRGPFNYGAIEKEARDALQVEEAAQLAQVEAPEDLQAVEA